MYKYCQAWVVNQHVCGVSILAAQPLYLSFETVKTGQACSSYRHKYKLSILLCLSDFSTRFNIPSEESIP